MCVLKCVLKCVILVKRQRLGGRGSIYSQIVYFSLSFVIIENIPGTALCFLLHLCRWRFVLFVSFRFFENLGNI